SSGHKMKEIDWKILLFQVLYTLYKIGERLAQFRHNSLDLDSIVVYSRAPEQELDYKVNDVNFILPNVNFEIKLQCYQFATTIDYIPNTVSGKKPNNVYYDVNYFINYLWLWCDQNDIKYPKSIEVFFGVIVPPKLKADTLTNFKGYDEGYDIVEMPSNRTI